MLNAKSHFMSRQDAAFYHQQHQSSTLKSSLRFLWHSKYPSWINIRYFAVEIYRPRWIKFEFIKLLDKWPIYKTIRNNKYLAKSELAEFYWLYHLSLKQSTVYGHSWVTSGAVSFKSIKICSFSRLSECAIFIIA